MTSVPEAVADPIRGQLLLKLLEIESTRCNAKTDEDERTESLAQLLEGEDHILERIHSGMNKYMSLLGIDDPDNIESRPLSIAEMQEMQESSVFGNPPRPRRQGTTVVQVTNEEAAMWDRIKRQCGQHGLDMTRMELMHIATNRGGPTSPEDQITCTFRIYR